MNLLMVGFSYSKSDMPLGGLYGKSLGVFTGDFSEGNLVSTGQLPMVSDSASLLEGINHVPCNLGFSINIALFLILENCFV